MIIVKRAAFFISVALIFLLAGGQRTDILLICLSSVLIARLTRRDGIDRAYLRLLVSPFLFLLFIIVAGVLPAAFAGSSGNIREFTGIVESVLISLGLSWPITTLYRLHRLSFPSVRFRTILPVLALVLFGVLKANTAYVIIIVLWLCIRGLPKEWLGLIASGRIWKNAGLLITAPAGVLFLTRTVESGQSADDIVIQTHGIGGSVFDVLRLFLCVYWFSFGFYICIRGFRHMILGSSIRFRLGLTYVFSTLIPAILALLLIFVAVFAGIGSLKARMVSKLIEEDLRGLRMMLSDTRSGIAADSDSIRTGIYMRVPRHSRAQTSDLITSADIPRRPSMESSREFAGIISDYRTLFPDNGTASADDEDEDEIWLHLATALKPELPESILPPTEWIGVSFPVEGIVPTGENRAAMVAVRPVNGDHRFLLLACRSFDGDFIERYKHIVQSDLIIHPTQSMSIWVGSTMTLGDSDETERADTTYDRYADSYWHVSRVATATVDEGKGFFERPFYHGICELRVTDSGDDARRDIRGFVIVRTSIADLVRTLASTRGMNVLAVVIIAVLSVLIFLAVIFSSTLGFSMLGSITQAVGLLKKGAEKLRTGDLDTRIELESRDELTKLARGFNEMAADLKRLVDETAERERLQKELQIARQIQRNLLPGKLPSIPGFQLAAESRPALEVGGDYYDLLSLDERHLVLVVADVTGKGIASAMLMSNVQSALRVLLHQNLSLDTVISRLNGMVWQTSTPEMFVTMFIGVVDIHEHRMTYVNAGHNFPLIVRDGMIHELSATGMVIGAFPKESHDVESVDLETGDVLVLYSDGITEAMNQDGEEFGLDRFTTTLLKNKHLDANHIQDSIITAVKGHSGSARQSDDITLTILKLT